MALVIGLKTISPPVYPRAIKDPRTRIPTLGANSSVVPGSIVNVAPGIIVISDKTTYEFSRGAIVNDSKIFPPNTPLDM